MKKYFLAKQGLELKLLSIALQNLIMSPIFLILTFLITSITINYIDCDSLIMFKIIFIFLNILWIIRNSIVKVYDNRIVYKSIIGTNKVVEINEILSLDLLTTKKFKEKIFNSSQINPLITNCFSVLIPLKNVILFKNRYNREITIGVWNYQRLLNIFNEKLSNAEFAVNISENFQENIHYQSFGKIKCFLRMPCISHLVLYFRHFAETILLPAIITLIIQWLFSLTNININKYALIILFLILSVLIYLKIIIVIIDDSLKIIKLNIFTNGNKNVIKYEVLKNLHYLDSTSEFEKIKADISKTNIITLFYKKHIDNTIMFELENNIQVILSVSNHKKIYDVLEHSVQDNLN